MADEAKAMATMIANIEKQTGKTFAQLAAVVTKSKLTKHTELRTMLMEQFGLGHGQANTVVHLARKSDGASAAAAAGQSADDVLGAIVKPLQANQPVRVRGTRGGTELDFLLVNASACTGRGR